MTDHSTEAHVRMPFAQSQAERRFGLTDLALIAMTFIWGSNFVVVKAALGQFHPMAFIALRFLCAAILLMAFAYVHEGRLHLRSAAWGQLTLAGLIGTTLYQPLFINGLALASASNSALILATTPAFIALMNRLLGRERLARQGWLGIALSFFGIVLIVQSSGAAAPLGRSAAAPVPGDALILACTVLWSLYSVISAPLLRQSSSLSVTALSTLLGTLPLLVITAPWLMTQDWSRVHANGWLGLAYSATFAIVVAYIIWNLGIQRIGGARTATYNNLTPVIATLAAALFLNEPITWLKLIGAGIIFIGLYLTRTARVIVEG